MDLFLRMKTKSNSNEAKGEYVSCSEPTAEIVYLRKLLKELGKLLNEPTDNVHRQQGLCPFSRKQFVSQTHETH